MLEDDLKSDASGGLSLLTSIPPRLFRRSGRHATANADYGRQYQRHCVASWIKSGFAVTSVNSLAESGFQNALFPGVRSYTTRGDAFRLVGRPLVRLSDLLSPASEIVCIVNADVELDVAPSAMEQLRGLSKGEAVFARRIDYTSESGQALGKKLAGGFDFIACHRASLGPATLSNFVFGMPWWDHFLAVQHLLKGGTFVQPKGISAFHLVHDDRWSSMHFNQFGRVFCDAVAGIIDADTATTPQALNYVARFKSILYSPEALRNGRLSWLFKVPGMSLSRLAERRRIQALSVMNTEQLQFIDPL